MFSKIMDYWTCWIIIHFLINCQNYVSDEKNKSSVPTNLSTSLYRLLYHCGVLQQIVGKPLSRSVQISPLFVCPRPHLQTKIQRKPLWTWTIYQQTIASLYHYSVPFLICTDVPLLFRRSFLKNFCWLVLVHPPMLFFSSIHTPYSSPSKQQSRQWPRSFIVNSLLVGQASGQEGCGPDYIFRNLILLVKIPIDFLAFFYRTPLLFPPLPRSRKIAATASLSTSCHPALFLTSYLLIIPCAEFAYVYFPLFLLFGDTYSSSPYPPSCKIN